MENAIKAFYMGFGMILGVLLLGIFVYLFRTGGRTAENYEQGKAVEQINAFNAQFEDFDNMADQNDASKSFSFNSKGNSIFDVISCANLAYDINKKNEFDLQNSVTVVVKIGSETYYIHPLEQQKNNNFIKNKTFENAKSGVPDSNYKDFYELLEEYGDVRIVNILDNPAATTPKIISAHETIYKYYFNVGAGDIEYSEVTGKVNKITFNLYETKLKNEASAQDFNSQYYWKDI